MAHTGASRVSSRVERPASPGAAQVERRLRDVAPRARKRNRGRAARRHDRRGDRAHVWVYGADAPRRAPYALAQRALAGRCPVIPPDGLWGVRRMCAPRSTIPCTDPATIKCGSPLAPATRCPARSRTESRRSRLATTSPSRQKPQKTASRRQGQRPYRSSPTGSKPCDPQFQSGSLDPGPSMRLSHGAVKRCRPDASLVWIGGGADQASW